MEGVGLRRSLGLGRATFPLASSTQERRNSMHLRRHTKSICFCLSVWLSILRLLFTHCFVYEAPVSRVVIGPVPQDSVLSQPRSSLRPYGPLHLCLGLRAWPESHVNGVSCVPGCEGFNGGLGDEQSQPMSSIADEVVLDNYLGMRCRH